MSEPDWATVLEYLYRRDGMFEVEVESESEEEPDGEERYNALTEKLRAELDLKVDSHDDTHGILNHLEMNDLITKEVGRTTPRIRLQPDGFEVAHERELAERQTKTNLMLVFLTLALVMATIVGNQPSDPLRSWGSVIVLGFILSALYYTDIFQFRG